ncbi:MAG: toxin [Deltaproteobacteria bacterium]|nr:toxin [Deltaproteobacteria bacterium]
MSTYNFHSTEQFDEKLERIEKRDPSGYQRIMRVINRLLETPGDADGRMHGLHHGRLKKYVGRRDYRLIYQWCEKCRKEAKKLAEHCGSCGDVNDRSVIFFDLFHKNEQASHLRHLVP